MAQAPQDSRDLTDRFIQFYRKYYRDEIGTLAQKYPNEQRSLYVDYEDLYKFDTELAEDYRKQPDQIREYAEEALRLYDLPADVKLGRAHVRLQNLPETVDIRNIRVHDDHIGRLIAVQGIVRKATDVRPKITEAAFECQRCGTMTYIPQSDSGFQEPHECQGCERQGPFHVDFDQSEFIDAQKVRVQESPEGLRGGETPQSIDIDLEDDVTGRVTAGDHVTVTGVLHIEQQTSGNEKTPIFDLYMDGVSVQIEDEEFEDMDITDEDVAEIVDLSNEPDIYEQMVASVAPSIYGYDEEKLAMILQLFSGVTKHLPDGSRIRGDLHMLLIGDPGTGKCVDGDTLVTLADGSETPIRELVEDNLDDPKPVDDGVWDTVDIDVPSMAADGSLTTKQATKVWKREAPEKMYRIRTASGKELTATPSHPLFVVRDGQPNAVVADNLEVGQAVAVPEPRRLAVSDSDTKGANSGPSVVSDGGIATDEITSIETRSPDEDWVYDLEVAGTHSYLSNNIVSHNSAMLQYIRNIAPRSVYTSGKGSSSAGLTAAAVRDDFGDGQQWTLEAGALVLADKGIAAVDELDKMRCVTGDTLVRLGDGSTARIADLSADATSQGTVEELPNGRTIRDIDFDVWTMTEDERIDQRPVTAIHEYDAPQTLYEISLSNGAELTATPDHPFFVSEGGTRVERPTESLEPGDLVYVPDRTGSALADGGTRLSDSASDPSMGTPSGSDEGEIGSVSLESIERIDPVTVDSDSDVRVYDLTVQGTHNFVANGMIVHNSEDRSAMHEALEQQSYHPNSEILLSDGRRVEIGPFVDEMIDEHADEVVDGVDCEILPVDDVGVHTVDLDTNDVDKVGIDRVSRHEAPDEFVRVTFSNGRSVTVTPEHPMFVDGGGEVGTVDAAEISAGDFVPAPRKLPNSAAPMPLADEEHRGKERDVDLPEEMSPKLAEVLGFLTAEGHSYSGGRTHEIGFSNQDERLLGRMDRLMFDVFGLESTDAVNGAGTTTQRWVSTKLYRWFESNFPEVMEKSRQKRMPAAVLGASEEEIRRFLVGAFAGDGGVESEAMSFSTASPGLAEDYADALLKIGVASRIHHDDAEDSWKTYVMGDSTERFVEAVVDPADDRYAKAREFVERSTEIERHHDVLPTSAARELRSLKRLLGVPLDGRFRAALDEGYGVQISTVESEIEALRERVETVRSGIESVSTLAEARDLVGWSGRQLAERLPAATTSAVHYAEDGGYTAARRAEMRRNAIEAIEDALDEAEARLDALGSRCDLRYHRVRDVETVPNEGDDACEWVYDVTVEPTNTFVSGGVVLHNSISVSKAGINATLKSRCSLLGAANPKYGRFDQYEPIGEQIDLEPALISRFDLIFTVTDDPDPESDAELAEHIINTNYAGELHTQKSKVPSSEFTDEEVDSATEEVTPAIDAELLRKYIAYAKRNCYPTMTEEAKEVIRNFYVDFRAKGADEDAPVPVTARKLEALVRLSEASARLRLSDTVDREDAVRVTEIVESCLRDIGMDPETGEFDADIVETGTSKNQRDRIKNLKHLIEELETEYEEGAPVEEVIERATADLGLDESKAEDEIENLRRKGEVYEPRTDYLRTT